MSVLDLLDVFEEQGCKQPLYGGYGVIAEDAIPKPAFNAFALLHRLGYERLAVSSDGALVTRRKDGTLVFAAWNMADPGATGAAKDVEFKFEHARISSVQVTRLDPDHGDVHKAYAAMGSPRYPTKEQIEKLRAAAKLLAPEKHAVKNGSLVLTIPAQGLVLIEAKPAH